MQTRIKNKDEIKILEGNGEKKDGLKKEEKQLLKNDTNSKKGQTFEIEMKFNLFYFKHYYFNFKIN